MKNLMSLLSNWRFLLIGAILLILSGGVFAIKQFVRGYEKEQARLEKVIADKDSEITSLKTDLFQQQQKNATLQTLIDSIRDDLASSDAAKVVLEMELDKAKGRLTVIQKTLKENGQEERELLYSGDPKASAEALAEFNARINADFHVIEGYSE